MLKQIVFCLVIGYAFGCFSTGTLVGKIYHVDLKEHGSGNSGSTNALRTLGVKAGIITLLGDVAKAIIPILIMRQFVDHNVLSTSLITLYTGLGVVCGHNFPFWMKFKGGKGIASMAGVIIMFSLPLTLAEIIIFVSIVAITRYVSLGSLVVSTVFVLYTAIFCRNQPDYIHMVIVCCVFMALAFFKHRANIKRLFLGTENKIGKKCN
ncbi:acyl-phosphate:glycerol-3-phosphate O-acyltransferase PlsY [Lachnospiraceae bacterium KM106-2]|nr:acyl-phosphate:glycerol-3-phosphate O-acyltransferase PlsY [Lachnospiraceae bacterium KM106-2]